MILALRALGVGDLATAVPALRGLRRAVPGEELWLAAPGWLAPLVPLVGAVDRLLPVPEPAVRAGRTLARRVLAGQLPAAPRLAVNLHGRGPQSHEFLAAAHPERQFGFAAPAAGHRAGPEWLTDEHEVDRWCRLLHWYGVPADRADLALRVPESATPDGLTIVHPAGKGSERRWPADRFAAVARELAGAGHRVVVTGATAERELARRVAEGAGLPARAVLAGRTGLAELAGLVAHAQLLISGDTGVGHLATAYQTPSVLLFGPTRPGRWGPPPDRPWHRVLWYAAARAGGGGSDERGFGGGSGLGGRPGAGSLRSPGGSGGRGAEMQPEVHPALARITVAEVLAAAAEVLVAAEATMRGRSHR